MNSWEMSRKWPGWYQEVLGSIYVQYFRECGEMENFGKFFPVYPYYAYTGKAYIGAGGMKCNG